MAAIRTPRKPKRYLYLRVTGQKYYREVGLECLGLMKHVALVFDGVVISVPSAYEYRATEDSLPVATGYAAKAELMDVIWMRQLHVSWLGWLLPGLRSKWTYLTDTDRLTDPEYYAIAMRVGARDSQLNEFDGYGLYCEPHARRSRSPITELLKHGTITASTKLGMMRAIEAASFACSKPRLVYACYGASANRPNHYIRNFRHFNAIEVTNSGMWYQKPRKIDPALGYSDITKVLPGETRPKAAMPQFMVGFADGLVTPAWIKHFESTKIWTNYLKQYPKTTGTLWYLAETTGDTPSKIRTVVNDALRKGMRREE